MGAIPEKNREALRILRELRATPDDMGHEWWEEFREWLMSNRLRLRQPEAEEGCGTMGRVIEERAKAAESTQPSPDVFARNRRLKALLHRWRATPDDKGEEWWDEFQEWLENHRLDLSRGQQ